MSQRPRPESRRRLAFVLVAACAAAISWLPAGIGNVGRKSTTLNGSFIRVTLPTGPPITHNIIPGETAEMARDAIVAQINDPNLASPYVAVSFTDPADANLAAFKITTGGNPPVSLQIDENEINLDDIGVRFTAGRAQATFRKANSAGNTVAANGSYRLRVEALAGPDYDQTFNTTIPPNNSAAGLDASIKTSLQSAGYSVVETATSLVVSRPGDLIVAIQVDSSDTGIIIHDVSMAMMPGVPSLSDYALFAVVVVLTGLGMALLRRQPPIPHGEKID